MMGELCDRRPNLAEENWRCLLPLVEDASYELATNNYIAAGGSGFRVLQRNTTQIDTLLPQRDVLTDYIRNGPACGTNDRGELAPCSIDADCVAAVGDGYTCTCDATQPAWDESMAACIEPMGGASCGGEGSCVLRGCAEAVEQFHIERQCAAALDSLARQRCECDARSDAAEECKFLACITDDLGAVTDGRLRMVAF
jgi:5'-nucleotidase